MIGTVLKRTILYTKAYKIRLRKSRDNHRPMCIQASSRLVMQGGPRDGVSLGTCYLDEKNLTEMHGTALSLNNRSQLGSIKMAQRECFFRTHCLCSASID